jgi:signal transduction histidine kinase
MRFLTEDNLSNAIILTSFFIITSLMLFTGYFFISKQYDTMEREIIETKTRLHDLRKEQIVREVEAVVDFIEFKKASYDTMNIKELAKLQDDILKWIPTIRFGTPKDNYIFAYQVYDLRGGEFFAKMIINPNRPDLVGKFISDEYKDAEGVQFRKIALENIRQKGHAFVTYMYKKPGSQTLNPKITYFYHYEPWGWIIAAGAYLDDIDTLLAQKRAALIRDVRIDITSTILIFLLFSLIANSLAIILGKQIEGFFHQYRQEVESKTNQLKEFNQNLEKRVHEEVAKNQEQERLMIQKSKFIALGEMISNIAHQWRQPLSELSALLMGLKFRYKMRTLDDALIDKKGKEAEDLIEYMSQTIDDFRHFFTPQKQKNSFSILHSIEGALKICGASLVDYKISVHVNVAKDVSIFGFENEYEQVLLNLITNAKDALMASNPPNPYIVIELEVLPQYLYLHVRDNAGGIKTHPIEKIFEPYFSTKESSQGTGIGLYMAKLIVEKSMQGNLEARNTNEGAEFTIMLKKG